MLNKLYFVIALAIICGLFTACSSNNNQQSNTPVNTINTNTTEAQKSPETDLANKEAKTETTGTTHCENLKRQDMALDKKQTFAIDFKPFEKSCFATFHDPEFTDPALGSQYFIYQNGKEVYEFPEQFNGGNTTCWIDAVAFEDLNNDQLKDVVIAGKCGAKSGAYSENMVYINNGKDFSVNKDANMEMMDFTKIGQVKDYVRRHQEDFSK